MGCCPENAASCLYSLESEAWRSAVFSDYQSRHVILEIKTQQSGQYAKLGISRVTLYRYVGPNGELREHGHRVLNP